MGVRGDGLSRPSLPSLGSGPPVRAGGRAAADPAPGVSSHSITVGSISSTGAVSADYSSLTYGELAYFDYLNAHGGVNGRKICYQYHPR